MSRSAALSAVLVDELVRGGVREVVLCPGSRNAPLAIAWHRASLAGRVRLHVRIDERSAGFLALGLAARSGAPVPVVTTSGTAVANLHPAVVEAGHSGIPVVVLSADRPPELLGTGANQTIDQNRMFGPAVRLAVSVAAETENPPQYASRDETSLAASRWRSAVCRALAAATGSRDGAPGPVQLNVSLSEPLLTDLPPDPDADPRLAGRADGGPWTTVAPVAVEAPLHVDLSLDTLVVAGHGAVATPALDGVPTVAEPGAPAPTVAVHPLAVDALRPAQVVVLGRPTLHRPVLRLLGSGVPVHVVDVGRRWTDVAGAARSVGTWVETTGTPAAAWVERAGAVSDRAAAALADVLAHAPKPTGLHVAAAVAGALAPGDQLVVGASNPVRDASWVGVPRAGVRVLSNRGASGIDGTVATAVGAALAHPGRTLALLGDLTFLHDANGLLVGPLEPVPAQLTIVVANDDGGGIFALLEQGGPAFDTHFERVFGTPHGTDLGALCAAHGVAHRVVEVDDLAASITQPHSGIRVLEVRTERDGLRELHAAVRAALEG
ncbi:2-succinyl-5-enolpyruvyl-6-hydroxy-3-cyclohexene-1-carboxylic-acid synthase [Rhodococcus aerolatus]